MGQAQRARETDDPGALLPARLARYRYPCIAFFPSSPEFTIRDTICEIGCAKRPLEMTQILVLHTIAIIFPVLGCIEGTLLTHPLSARPRHSREDKGERCAATCWCAHMTVA